VTPANHTQKPLRDESKLMNNTHQLQGKMQLWNINKSSPIKLNQTTTTHSTLSDEILTKAIKTSCHAKIA